MDKLIVAQLKVILLICLGDFNRKFKEHMI